MLLWLANGGDGENPQQSWPMTGLKPDGGPECTGIFRSRAAFDVDGRTEHSSPVFTSLRGGSCHGGVSGSDYGLRWRGDQGTEDKSLIMVDIRDVG
jgi:hypothetical protein